MRVLVIAPHADDEVIGAGGTIARHVAQGDDVYLCLVTQPYSPPWSEQHLAAARPQVRAVQQVLGLRELFFLGFPTVRLNTVPQIELASALQKVLDEVQSEVVYTSSPCDVNEDHRIVYDRTLVAARPLPGSPVRRLLAYETPSTAHFGLPAGCAPFVPNVFVDIAEFLDKKLEAMACYRTQLRDWPHPRSLQALRLFAEERGLSVGLKAAECFCLVRERI